MRAAAERRSGSGGLGTTPSTARNSSEAIPLASSGYRITRYLSRSPMPTKRSVRRMASCRSCAFALLDRAAGCWRAILAPAVRQPGPQRAPSDGAWSAPPSRARRPPLAALHARANQLLGGGPPRSTRCWPRCTAIRSWSTSGPRGAVRARPSFRPFSGRRSVRPAGGVRRHQRQGPQRSAAAFLQTLPGHLSELHRSARERSPGRSRPRPTTRRRSTSTAAARSSSTTPART